MNNTYVIALLLSIANITLAPHPEISCDICHALESLPFQLVAQKDNNIAIDMFKLTLDAELTARRIPFLMNLILPLLAPYLVHLMSYINKQCIKQIIRGIKKQTDLDLNILNKNIEEFKSDIETINAEIDETRC